MPSVWQWPADKITHVPHGLHTYVHCASITGQPVKAMHSNVQWTSSPSWSPIASLSTLTYKRCVGGSLYACSVFTLHWRMGLYQRHIGMTGIMNSLALNSLTQYIGLRPILFQCTKSINFTVLVKCTNSLSRPLQIANITTTYQLNSSLQATSHMHVYSYANSRLTRCDSSPIV